MRSCAVSVILDKILIPTQGATQSGGSLFSFVWQIPNKIAIPILIVDIAMIMVGAVWGKPWKDALITLGICIAIGGIGAFLTRMFMK